MEDVLKSEEDKVFIVTPFPFEFKTKLFEKTKFIDDIAFKVIPSAVDL